MEHPTGKPIVPLDGLVWLAHIVTSPEAIPVA